ncbi:MAG: hypothetical protein ACLSHC_14805 [Bilophila wadsworthia]
MKATGFWNSNGAGAAWGTEIVDVSGCVVMPGESTPIPRQPDGGRRTSAVSSRNAGGGMGRHHDHRGTPGFGRRDAICPISPPRIWSRRMAAATGLRLARCVPACGRRRLTIRGRAGFPRSIPLTELDDEGLLQVLTPHPGMRAACSPSI